MILPSPDAAFRPVRLDLPDLDPQLRSAPDEDPIVEEMVERLRRGLSGLVALDPWGRPTAWRDVVRTALGPALHELRDARTSVALTAAVERDATAASEPTDVPDPGTADAEVAEPPETFDADLYPAPKHAARRAPTLRELRAQLEQAEAQAAAS